MKTHGKHMEAIWENMIKYESTIALPKKIDFNKIILKMTGKAKLF